MTEGGGRPGLATHELLQAVSARTPAALAFLAGATTPTDVAAWQAALRAALRRVLGIEPEPPGAVPFDVTETVACDGYERHHVYYEGAFGGTGAAYLLVPDGLAAGVGAPGLLCLHGHGGNYGKSLVAGAPYSADEAQVIARHAYDYAARFARRGYVTLAPDALGFGERALDKAAGYHTAMGLVAEYLGRSLVGLRLLDDARALSVLAAQPPVDAGRLGAVELSEGGKRALFLAALDERVRATVDSGYFTSLRHEIGDWRRLYGWDLCNHLFGLLPVCDLPDVAALVAPRALLIQNGRLDPLYGVEAVEAGFATVRRAYAAAGAPEAAALDLFEGEHVFYAPPAEAWRDRHLKPGP